MTYVTNRRRRSPGRARLQLVDSGSRGKHLISRCKQIFIRRIRGREATLERFARLPVAALNSGNEQLLQRQLRYDVVPIRWIPILVGYVQRLVRTSLRRRMRGERRKILLHVPPRIRHGLPFNGSDLDSAPARGPTGSQQLVIPLCGWRRPWDDGGRRMASKPLGKGAEVRSNDRDAGCQRYGERVRIRFRNLRGKPDNVGPFGRKKHWKIAIFVLAVHRNRDLGPLRHRFRRRAEDAE